MKIYNTFTRQKEEFQPINPPNVLMYNCGPTVYDYFHIGNARNFVVMEVIRRYLIYKGYRVKYVQNFTDIDDKIINRAKQEGIPWDKVAEKYIDCYWKDSTALNVSRADVHPRATQVIPQMIEAVQQLIQSGHAYENKGSVYFRVSSYNGFGELSGKKMDELKSGARVDVDEEKENPADFALWKASKPGEPSWDSPWGKGRPGWHIECSVMAREYLGESIDIHSGATDLIFPHHENERAQSECLSGKPFVKYWLHNGFLTINKEKMSKSLGNFFKINEVLDQFDPVTVRYFLLSAHYRSPLDFSKENLEEAQRAVQRIREAIESVDKLSDLWLKSEKNILPSSAVSGEQELNSQIQEWEEPFFEAMDDDFNTPRAFAVIFDIVGRIYEYQKQLNAVGNNKSEGLLLIGKMKGLVISVLKLSGVLGLEIKKETAQTAESTQSLDSALIDLLIDIRKLARQKKMWEIADEIRNRLMGLGITLEDTPHGTIWKK